MHNTIRLKEITIDEGQKLAGPGNSFIKTIEDFFETEITLRGDQLYLADIELKETILNVIETMLKEIRSSQELKTSDVIYICNLAKQNKHELYSSLRQKYVGRMRNGKVVFPKTIGQEYFVDMMIKKDVVFSTGPAGTGKTFLSVAYASSLLKNNQIKKIILTRPAVEAGESLGFLPGDMKEKVDPYLRPLYDALYDMLGAEQTERLIENGTIEIAPLAYMRGRTLNDAFVILDEAQNATPNQIKMFLTRLGFNSKMVINGDVTQIDLAHPKDSGLASAYSLLGDIDDIAFVRLTSKDVVRHPLVQKIIDAYEKNGD